MLHCLKDVVNAHPLASLAQSFFSSLWPDLIEAWNDEGSSLDLKDHLLQSSPICRRKPLDTGDFRSQRKVFTPHHCE